MPTQEVARVACSSALLRRGGHRPHRVLLDGGGEDSWGDGVVLYAHSPVATLTAYASGWARCSAAGDARWRWGDPLALWQKFVDAARAENALAGGGIVTALSYDLKHAVERLPRRLPWLQQPVLFAACYDWAYRADWRTQRARITAADAARLGAELAWHARADRPAAERSPHRDLGPRRAIGQRAYGAMLERAQEYIAAGHVYQVNLAQPFRVAAAQVDGAALVAAWSERYPMPYAAYVDAGDFALVSNSPECFLRVEGEDVATFPIKGTRRGATEAAELVSDAKERAEHVMIVDLERNDLGRVCVTGSVEAGPLFAVRAYPLLTHMVSEVRGRLRPGTSLSDVLRATFPGGSVTGAPKIRAMQIIEELEPAPRGFYTGAIGWTEPDGRTTFNLAIRTATLDAQGLTYWAGGGIVADSRADSEYAESLLKAEALARALAAMEKVRG
ncbi:MAG: anthranilate synthase component I family protein [Candidatus Binatia bacterium]